VHVPPFRPILRARGSGGLVRFPPGAERGTRTIDAVDSQGAESGPAGWKTTPETSTREASVRSMRPV